MSAKGLSLGRKVWVASDSVTESKLIPLATQQPNKLREMLGRGIATLFRKPANQEDSVPKNHLAWVWMLVSL